MTTPAAPGAPEGGQIDVDPAAPGAQEPEPQPDPTPAPKPTAPQRLGKPLAPGAPQQPAEPDKPADPQDVSELPDWAQKLIKDARADAGKARTTAKQQAAEEARQSMLAEISKALGLDPDAEPTVDDLTTQLNERQARIDELEAAQTENAYREAVRTAASAVNADADALLDSASFLKAVEAELGDEFDDDELTAAVAKVAKEYATKPRFAKATAPARSGGEIIGGPPPAKAQRPRSLTQALSRAYGGD